MGSLITSEDQNLSFTSDLEEDIITTRLGYWYNSRSAKGHILKVSESAPVTP